MSGNEGPVSVFGRPAKTEVVGSNPAVVRLETWFHVSCSEPVAQWQSAVWNSPEMATSWGEAQASDAQEIAASLGNAR